MSEDKIMDQSQLANDVSDKINIDMKRQFLVKPLDPIKVKKEFSKPVATDNTPKKDENGVEAVDYDKVETEVKEVESDFRKGVILKVPFEYQRNVGNSKEWEEMEIKVGDIVIYYGKYATWFDLLKDTQLISGHDIVGIERASK